MNRYMERQLTGLHEAGKEANFKKTALIFAAAALIIVVLPYIHIGVFYSLWAEKPEVNRGKCVCDCFDTVFRGRYEYPPSAYKHMYFNATSNALKIWLVVVLGVLAFYETLKYLFNVFQAGRLRNQMVVVFLSSLYPHYYGWWASINYLNEDYYSQWYHQIFFSLTEALSTAVVIHLCNRDNRIQTWKLLLIFNINFMHIIIGCLDQFVGNIMYREGKGFEVVRDLALFMPDILHVLVPFFELQILAEHRRVSILKLFYREELMLSVVGVIMFSLLGKNL